MSHIRRIRGRHRPRGIAGGLAAAAALAGLAGCGAAAARPAARPAAHRAAVTVADGRHATSHRRPIYPLTGLPAPSAAAASRPVLAVKIDNVAGSFPQWGVNRADVVVEEVVEGGLTRLVAAFQSHDAARVGPIRSARPVDADLERWWNGGLLAFSGAAPGEIRPSIEHGHALLVNATTDGAPFYRAAGYAAPHNLFSSTTALRRSADGLAKARKAKIGRPLRPLFAFGTPTGRPARRVALTVSPAASSMWRYSAAAHGYLRWQNGTPDVMAGAGQVHATNVVVMQVQLRQTPIVDAAGNHDPLDVILGKGRAWVFSHGRMAAGTWSRRTDADPTVLRGRKGKTLAVTPGVTWVELLPAGRVPSVS
jgi:hypothetical protein